jgi:hypothetical protein
VRDGERGAARQRAPVEERLDPGTGLPCFTRRPGAEDQLALGAKLGCVARGRLRRANAEQTRAAAASRIAPRPIAVQPISVRNGPFVQH